jgi:uncharacterized protein (TIGR00369 family)
MSGPPEGFQPHYRKSPLTDPWEPLYSRRTGDALQLGLRIAQAHTNSRGFAHGGLVSALADNAMGLSCGLALDGGGGLLTVNLALDFLSVAKIGQWLQVEPTVVKRGKSLCFASALVTADGKPCARASATFQVVS